jgi:putative membrane protein
VRPNLRDHLANERTFLAWLRTSIAIIAFGFVMDKFSLYLKYLDPSMSAQTGSLRASLIGIGLLWAGTLLIPLALWRFLNEQRDIDLPEATRSGNWTIVTLAILLTAVGVYLAFTVGS